MNQQNLPGESTITTLWIIALVCVLLGCCCGIVSALPALIVSIISLVMANKNIKLFQANPGEFLAHSYSSVKTGKIMSIINIVLSSIIFLGYMLYFLIYGAFIWTALATGLTNGAFNEFSDDFNSETYEENSNTWEEDVYRGWEEEVDSIANDTLLINTFETDTLNQR
ncbi:hypothetical protein ACFQO1_01355 [Jejudonia soesokkakensis]|uniref:DUF4190 domain-containing protein n=1 Tax=Jejudonia soesokkakensis TaxID=1323432 RepID=A0ABW2MQZ8_9FLAO